MRSDTKSPSAKCPRCGHVAKYHDPLYGCSIMLNDDDQCLCGTTWDGISVRAPSPAPASHSEVAEEIAADIRKRYEGQCTVFMDDLEEIIAPVLDEWREQIRKGAKHE